MRPAGTGAQVSAASRLAMSVMRLERRLRQRSAGGVTASQYAALVTISKRGELTLGELAGAEGVAPPSMTRIAANLEQAGLVHRRPDPLDRRVALIALSPPGRSCCVRPGPGASCTCASASRPWLPKTWPSWTGRPSS